MANKPYYGAYSSRMTLSYDGGSTTVRSGGRYKEIISKAIELDNADAFVKLFTVDADQGTGGVKSIAANQVRDFNAMLIHNESDAAVEVLYTTGRFTDNSGSADTYDENISLTTFIPAGSYAYIDNPRIVGYEHDLGGGTPTSSMNGETANTTAFDPTYLTDSGVTLAASPTAAYDNTSWTVNDSDKVAPGDILVLSPMGKGMNAVSGAHTFEIVRVRSITNTTTIVVERGLYKTTPCAHDHTDSDQQKLYFWGFNELVPPAFVTSDDITATASTATDTGGAMATIVTAGDINWIDEGFIAGMFVSIVGGSTDWNDDCGLITEVTSTTLTVHRWAGTIEAKGAGSGWDAVTGYWCGTDANGNYKNNTFLGTACRSDNHIQGIVPGGQYIDFPVPVSQKLGLRGLTTKTSTGLTASTTYNFALNIDGQRETISFTTDANNLNWGGINGVLSKIQSALSTKVKDGSLYRNVTCTLENGDIVFKSHTGGGSWNGYCTNRGTDHRNTTGASQVDIQDTASGNQFLGSGKVPGSMQPATSNDFKPTETLHPSTSEVINSYDNIMIDRGDGTMRRNSGGRGSINYETGAINLSGLPAWSQLQGYIIKNSAHCGQLDTVAGESRNGITEVYARSVNAKANAKIRLTLLA